MYARWAVFACIMIAVCAAPGTDVAAQSRADINDPVDRHALALFDRLQPRTFRNHAEFCGYIGYDDHGAIVATPPERGDMSTCDPGDIPDELDIVASYHTHGRFDFDADSEVPSVDDLLSDFDEDIDGYVATPGGRVWLNLVEERRTILLCGRNCVPADPQFRPCPALRPIETYTVRSLRRRQSRDDGRC